MQTDSHPKDADPYIQWNHIDGPLLVCSDGTLHWLTAIERLCLLVGLTNVKQLDSKHNGEPRRAG